MSVSMVMVVVPFVAGWGAASVRVLRALVIAVMGLSSRVRVRWVVGGVSLGSIAQAWWVRWVASAMSLGCGVAWGKAAAVCGWVARLVMWRLLVCVVEKCGEFLGGDVVGSGEDDERTGAC